MLTPQFRVEQDEASVTVYARTPHIQASSVDWLVTEDAEFSLHAKPYLLRLRLPGKLIPDEDRAQARYDVDSGVLSIRLEKETPGEFFPGLEMLSTLLAPTWKPPTTVSASVAAATASSPSSSRPGIEIVETGEPSSSSLPLVDWSRAVGVPHDADPMRPYARYGFNNEFSQYFAPLQAETSDVVDVPQPDTTSALQRRLARIEQEGSDFDPDHYLGDFMHSDEIAELLRYQPWWHQLARQRASILRSEQGIDVDALDTAAGADSACDSDMVADLPSSSGGGSGDRDDGAGDGDKASAGEREVPPPTTPIRGTDAEAEAGARASARDEADVVVVPERIEPVLVRFTREEQDALKELRNRPILLEDPRSTLLGLVELLYAYAYDWRTTLGDPTCESHWTIAKLSAMLAWLDPPLSIAETAATCVRRALTYPLYRHFDLASKILSQDVVDLLALGPSAVLRALLSVRRTFAGSEARRHLNTLFIDRYCVYVQNLPHPQFALLRHQLRLHPVRKDDVGLTLTSWEEQLSKLSL